MAEEKKKNNNANTTNSRFQVKELILISFFAALTGILSYVIIPLPFTPVPVSGQTLGVMLAGVFLKTRSAVLSQVVYVLLGTAGLPVFAGGTSGPGILAGPTGGYIWGFIIGAYVIAKIIGKRESKLWTILGLVIGGILVVYTCGVTQFMLVNNTSLMETVTLTMLPFLPGAFLKIAVAFLASRKINLDMLN